MSLVISRKQLESVVIYPYPEGDDRHILVTIESLGYGKVKLSFEAPNEVDIWRDELIERIPQASNTEQEAS